MAKNIQEHRGKGKMEKVKGKVKEKVGRAIDNEQMEAEGSGGRAKGAARETTAKTAGRAKGKAKEVSGRAERKMADTADRAGRGRRRAIEGEAEERFNR